MVFHLLFELEVYFQDCKSCVEQWSTTYEELADSNRSQAFLRWDVLSLGNATVLAAAAANVAEL